MDQTPLFFAILSGSIETVQVFLEAGASFDVADAVGLFLLCVSSYASSRFDHKHDQPFALFRNPISSTIKNKRQILPLRKDDISYAKRLLLQIDYISPMLFQLSC